MFPAQPAGYGTGKTEINLKTWEFSRNCKTWSQVQIPHDWAIAGPFDKKWDLQRVAITQNGETEATEKSGRSGALPWIGEGWYRTTVEIPQGYEAGELVFDGAMAEPRVSVNGQEAGYWAYGYNAFRVDVTPFLKKQPTSITSELAISVHLQNVEESSRWYPGAGLYRPVKLVLTKKTHIDDWSIYASTMQMEICDSMGMMVMAELFDMWLYSKCKNGYARFFKEWAVKDITNLVLNHRNHPSIVMWSIGNEIPEQWSEEGRQLSIQLQGLCHALDPTRPVTQGMDRAEAALKSGFAQAMEVPGFNYRVHKYENNIKQLPQGFLLGSETASTVSSRGVYKFPVKETDYSEFASYSPNYDPTAIQRADGQCSSYDVEWCPWSNLPDDDWRCQDDYPWVIGEFVWTGYDYLGEPTPYDEYWPSRSSYFGIFDLAGLPKDRYWLYRSKWNKAEHTVHLLPHWTWPKRKGQVTPVYCYTDGVEAELFVNGKSQGRLRKNPAERLDRYRLRWNDVKYEPGEIRVVAYDAEGHKIGEDVRRTAGKAVALVARAEVPSIQAGGDELMFVRIGVVDKQGVAVPTCQDELQFSVTGEARFEAVCNGDATSLESFRQPRMKLFNGELVVILRPTTKAGKVTLTVKDQRGRLKPAVLHLETK